MSLTAFMLGSAALGGLGNLITTGINQAHAIKARKAEQAFNAQQAEIARQFSAFEAEKSRRFSAEQAQLNRDFQERMSNTAYQRGIADLKAAGLNPALAYNNAGASSPAGSVGQTAMANSAQASASAPYAKMSSTLGQNALTAFQSYLSYQIAQDKLAYLYNRPSVKTVYVKHK